MAFKPKKKLNERVELVSLIDMIFILLVFFLVTSFVIRMPFQERSLNIPTPENVLGRAQIMVQFVDENRVFWIDQSVSNLVGDIEDNFGYLRSENLRDKIISELIEQNMITHEELDQKLTNLQEIADRDPFSRFFILIRCPNEIPYYRIVNVIAKISDTKYRNIKYGCVGGTLDQIRQCQRIYTVLERDERGRRRKNIRIDF